MGTPALWGGFIAFVLAMLALDLGVFHRKAHAVSLKEAAIWSCVWVSLALSFNAGMYFIYGPRPALEFLTGYLIEKALSVDNIFVILVIFSYFRVSPNYQHRVLFWGILGALAMRAVFIVLGAKLLQSFHWMIYLFGAFLIITAIRLMLETGEEKDLSKSLMTRLFRRFIPCTDGYREHHFVVKENGKWIATPLLLVLAVVEGTDLIFAVDSIPAIFAVTTDPFIVFTSNIFAILGLRSLFFLLAGVMDKFHYLKTGLALVLAFVGAKMLLVEVYKIPIGVSLGVIAGILSLSIVLSLLRNPAENVCEPKV
jgi:tellurite resistance protein TerC